ncbi:LacI family DNA-binding transcriptional regulator [Microbacterium sp. NPDC087589]|uniref:LacI family DNA-binding transcriptional regulator n=1 Tax=Microbacterium sp. NPDC087589 TaxID=3364191 RepID=UPI00382E8626
MRSTVTLLEVAAAAGVSVATASRALAGKDRVSAATVVRVKAEAQRLGYRVDPIARALREGSTRLIGMVVPVIGNPFYSRLLDAVEQVSHAHGFELLVADSHADPTEEARRLRVLAGRKVDGMLLAPTVSAAARESTVPMPVDVPLVQIDRVVGPAAADFVGVDNALGIGMLVEHLVSCGARTMMYVGADDVNNSGRERWQAFGAHAEIHGVTTPPPVRDGFDVKTGVAGAEAILRMPERPDAVVAGSDLIAFGLISRLREGGVSVPENILVTGFDGTDMAQLFYPTLTTVVQPIEAIAYEAVQFLRSRIDGSDAPWRSNRIAPALRVAGSTTR